MKASISLLLPSYHWIVIIIEFARVNCQNIFVSTFAGFIFERSVHIWECINRIQIIPNRYFLITMLTSRFSFEFSIFPIYNDCNFTFIKNECLWVNVYCLFNCTMHAKHMLLHWKVLWCLGKAPFSCLPLTFLLCLITSCLRKFASRLIINFD